MSLKGKQTPNSINVLCQLLQSSGLTINTTAAGFMGASTAETNYSAGSIITSTVLNTLKTSTNSAYEQIGGNVSQAVYNALVSMGSTTIPALGNAKPSTFLNAYSNSLSRYGFLRVLALQAHVDFAIGSGTYSDFLNSIMIANSFVSQTTSKIASLVNATDFLDGVYSNMNDLISGDITGVNQATVYWGQDLISSGRAINLATINKFGLPSNLLKTLLKNNALTQAVSIALIYSELTTTEINNILLNLSEPTVEQEKKIYGAFTAILNNDLHDVLVPLNVNTTKLTSLADLLNPIKLFPNSYASLTVPQYNVGINPANSKVYYLIYQNGGVNTQLNTLNYGSKLAGIIPSDIAVACEALSVAMQQIKNISVMDIEKFSKVVTNMETTLGLSVNGTSTPVDSNGVTAALNAIALGSGKYGTYTMCDFFGSMTGIEYHLDRIQALILKLQSTTLTTIYNDIATEMALVRSHNTVLSTLITQANTEIANIYNTQSSEVIELNALWNNLGKKLNSEINARALGLAGALVSDNNTIYSFVDSINTYALETGTCESAPVLESISDLTTIGGQSLIATMRETRNASRLGLIGGELDNDISDELPLESSNGLGIQRVSGESQAPGSFAGSPETNLIPQNLDIFNISSTILPSVFTPNQAATNVIDCNCDCWNNL